MIKIKFATIILILLCSYCYSQTIIYSQNFGVIPINGFPLGWSSSGTAGWNMSSSVVSTGYIGASGGANVKTGTSASSPDTLYFSSISTVGYNNICVLWAGRKTSTQITYPVFEWSTDSIVWNNVNYSDVSSVSTWDLVNAGANISLPSGANGVNNLRFRWIISANSPGSYRIDDFVVSTCTSSISNLPTCFAWDNDTIGNVLPYPIGWHSYGLGTPYTTGHIAPSSGKFDTQSDSLVIHFSSVADSLNYWLKGNTLSGIYQFDVLESSDGINYSTLNSYSVISGSWTYHNNIPDTASRYIKFVYTIKDNGNIAIDDVCLNSSSTKIHTLYYMYDNINIHPNPVKNTLYINNITNIDKITITNMYGQKVKSIENIKENNVEIAVCNLSEGIYIISFYNDNCIFKTLKFIK